MVIGILALIGGIIGFIDSFIHGNQAAMIPSSLITCIVAGLLIVGLQNERPGYLIPYLVLQVIFCLVSISILQRFRKFLLLGTVFENFENLLVCTFEHNLIFLTFHNKGALKIFWPTLCWRVNEFVPKFFQLKRSVDIRFSEIVTVDQQYP